MDNLGNPRQEIVNEKKSTKLVDFLNFAIDNYTLIFLFITFLSFGYKTYFLKERIIESFLLSFLTWNVGVRGLIAFVANWTPMFANQIAQSYEWPINNSFQREIAATEASLGTLGMLCNWISGDFWTATIIAVSLCWFISELGGLISITKSKKDPAYKLNQSLQTGMRLDLIFSVILLVLLVLWKNGY